MITESELFYQVRQVQPRFFGRGDTVDHTFITYIWPLPDERVLFACAERDQRDGHRSEIIAFALHVLDQRRGRLKRVAHLAGDNGSELAVTTAIWWMQGLRFEDLSSIDHGLLDYLGEIAWRMSPEQLAAFGEAYFAIPADAWGTHENPDPGPGEQLWELLLSMGFNEDFLHAHWQN